MADERSNEEKTEMATRLQAERASLPEFSIFGDNNWKSIDGQLAVLAGTSTYRSADDAYADELRLGRDGAYEIVRIFEWLNDDISTSEFFADDLSD